MDVNAIRDAFLSVDAAEMKLNAKIARRASEIIQFANSAVPTRLTTIQVDGGLRSDVHLLWMFAAPLYEQQERLDVFSKGLLDFVQQPPNQAGGFSTFNVYMPGRALPTLSGIEVVDRHRNHFQKLAVERTGFLDFVDSDIWNPRDHQTPDGVEFVLNDRRISEAVYWWTLMAFEFSTKYLDGEPLVLGVHLLNAESLTLIHREEWEWLSARNRNLKLPYMRLSELNEFKNAPKRIMDRLFNAFQFWTCPHFLSDGRLQAANSAPGIYVAWEKAQASSMAG